MNAHAEEATDDECLRLHAAWTEAGVEVKNQKCHHSQSFHISLLPAHIADDSTLSIRDEPSDIPEDSMPHTLNSFPTPNDREDQRAVRKATNLKHCHRIPTVFQRYRTFLKKNESKLLFIEHIMEKFVFYRFLMRYEYSDFYTEMFYAAWNIIRWINETVLVGFGEGIGMTIGKKEEWFGPKYAKRVGEQEKSIRLSHLNQPLAMSRMLVIVPIIRTILTATTCIYPALDAWSHRSQNSHSCNHIFNFPFNYLHQSHNVCGTCTDLSLKRRRLKYMMVQYHTTKLSYLLECVRFTARLALLSIFWCAHYRHRCLHDSHPKNNQYGNEGASIPILLRKGGELDPNEEIMSLKSIKVGLASSQYMGKRTGRRLISSASEQLSTPLIYISQQGVLAELRFLIANMLNTNTIGEALHVLRPLYWSFSEYSEWKRKFSSSKLLFKKQTIHNGASFSTAIWKAWFTSLMMDLLSDKLAHTLSEFWSSCASNFDRIECASSSSSLTKTSEQELRWRRGRYKFYLLRTPIYDVVTFPALTLIAKIVSRIPSFGLCRWAIGYVLDMLSYWNEHRYMME